MLALPYPDKSCHFYMPCFRPGTAVRLAGRHETVSHVVLRRRGLLVHLVGHTSPVQPEHLEVAPALFTRERQVR